MEECPKGWHALAGLATLPEERQRRGYKTGIFGKYHLGDLTSRSAVCNYDLFKEGSGKGLDLLLFLRVPTDLPTLRDEYSQITMIDDAVGLLRATNPEALIIFTADHGLSLGRHGFRGHGGRPIHQPCIWRPIRSR